MKVAVTNVVSTGRRMQVSDRFMSAPSRLTWSGTITFPICNLQPNSCEFAQHQQIVQCTLQSRLSLLERGPTTRVVCRACSGMRQILPTGREDRVKRRHDL